MNPAGWTTNCGSRQTGHPDLHPLLPFLGDNLLRIFGGDRVAGLMNAFRGGRHAD